MMDHRRYEVILCAEEPIAHHSESFGNSAIFMRRKVRQPDGTFVSVPTLTADTMRHGMREAAAYALLDAAGLLDAPGLTEAALRLLFAGGMITGKGDASTVKLDDYRRMIDLIPSVSLFGGCAGNRCIPGRLQVGDAMLLCLEQMHLLPGWVGDYLAAQEAQADTQRAFVEEVQRVRMDPALQPSKRLLLTEGERGKAEARLIASEAASAKGDAVEAEAAKSTMMPRRFETVVQGSLFFWRVSAVCHSALELDTFHLALGAFLGNARVGGKKGTGHGLLRALTAQKIEIRRPLENCTAIDPGALAPEAGELFRDHVKARAADVRSFLEQVDA
jgi:hypothetical protein